MRTGSSSLTGPPLRRRSDRAARRLVDNRRLPGRKCPEILDILERLTPPGVLLEHGVPGLGKALVGQIRGALNRDLLFDVGADTVSMFVPGGGIAVKLAKAAIDSNKKK